MEAGGEYNLDIYGDGKAMLSPREDANTAGTTASANNGSTTNYYACSDCGIGNLVNLNVAIQGGPDMRPAYPSANTNAAGQLIYRDGVVTNWASPNGKRIDATFTDRKGNNIEFPGVNITDKGVADGSGMTLSSIIHLDIDGINGLADLEHEYGHFLDLSSRFSGNNTSFFFEVGVPSFFSAWGESAYEHTKQSYEEIATRLAIDFFGPNSAIAQAKNLYAR